MAHILLNWYHYYQTQFSVGSVFIMQLSRRKGHDQVCFINLNGSYNPLSKCGFLYRIGILWKLTCLCQFFIYIHSNAFNTKSMYLYIPILLLPVKVYTNEPPHDITNKKACAPSKDSDQPGHPPGLIRVFAVRMKKAWVLSYPLSAQRGLWSVWADAQADPSLRWAHSHFVGFVMRRLTNKDGQKET